MIDNTKNLSKDSDPVSPIKKEESDLDSSFEDKSLMV